MLVNVKQSCVHQEINVKETEVLYRKGSLKYKFAYWATNVHKQIEWIIDYFEIKHNILKQHNYALP